MLIDRQNWPTHRPWVIFALAATLGSVGWYASSSVGQAEWPGGSSIPGFTFGVVGGLICLFEMLLWWRKKVRTWRIGRAQVWMRAHIWLGLLSVPLLILHSGFRLGGTLSTVLMVVFLIVIVSGVWGLLLQQYLPQRLLHDVPAETIFSQIERIVALILHEAELLVVATCGPGSGAATAAAGLSAQDQELLRSAPAEFLTIGAVRSAGYVQGMVLQTRVPQAPVPESAPLRDFFFEYVAPYLRAGDASGSALRHPSRATVMFRDLRTKLPPEAHSAVDALESWCEQRRQLDLQARLHFWLHNWLWVHLPLAAALTVLMFVHVWVALKYW